jgi:3-oxoacyl-[acyl-carrier protein] reductase
LFKDPSWPLVDRRISMQEKGKVALITGGGTGIGRASSLALARQGIQVAINYSKSAREAQETAQEAEKMGVSAITVQADVSKDAEVRAMVQKVMDTWGRIDMLINCAGWSQRTPFNDLEAHTEELWDRNLAINLKGVFFCSRAVADIMKRQGQGAIVTIASVAGITGVGSSIAYAASKAGVICLTKSLAKILAPEVRVNAVAPGLVETRWIEGWADADEIRDQTLKTTPLKRISTPEDIAEVVCFLATGARMMTGQILVVDGGKIM